MIKNVNSGDILKASDQNKIIDAINQLEAGSYSNNLKSAGYTKQRESYITLFQTKIQDSFTLKGRPKEYPDNKDDIKIFKGWWIFLGKDLDTLKNNVGNPDKIYVFNSNNEDVAGELQKEWIVRNGDGKFYDGWFDLQYDSSSIDSVRVAWIDLWNKDDDGEKTTIESSYFCFTDKEDKEEIKKQIEQYEEPEENQEFEVRGEPLIIATTTIPGYIEGAEQPYTITQLVQLHIGRYTPDELSDGNSTDTTSGLSVFNNAIQKSVDITNLSGDIYYKLYKFEDDERTDSETIKVNKQKADILIRLKDDNAKERHLDYISLSNLSKLTDSEESQNDGISPQQYSIETRTDLSGDAFYQLYNFDDGESQEEIENGDILIRKIADDGIKTLEYLSLSTLSSGNFKVDSEVTDLNQESLDRKEHTDGEKKINYIQLHNFDNPTILNFENISSDSMLIRKSDGNTTLEYGSIQSFQQSIINNVISNLVISVDSEVTELNQQSLEKKTRDDQEYLQLYHFDAPEILSFEDISNDAMLIRKSDGNTTLKYASIPSFKESISNDISTITNNIISNLVISVDSDITELEQKSLDQKVNSNNVDKKYIQLHNFDNDNTEKYEDIKETAQILIRDNKELKYLNLKDLSTGQIISGQIILGDANLQGKNNSINLVSSDTEAYYELYNFDKATSEKYADVSASGLLLLKNEKDLKYLSISELSNVLSLNLSVDSQLPGKDQYSIDINTSDSSVGPYLQLYNFDNNTFGTRTMEEARNWNSTVLLRSVDNNNPFLTYVSLSDFITDVPVDSYMAPTLHQYSIEWNSINEETGPFLQLNHFDMDTFSTNTIEEAKEYNSTILMRAVADNHPELIYVDLSSLSSNNEIISGDSDVLVDSYKSIKLVENSDKKKYYQLYDFDKPEAAPLSTYPDKIHWVCRYNDNSLVYVDAQESLKSYEPIKTDSTYGIGYSLETKYDAAYEKYYHQICNFDNSSMNFSWKIEPSEYDIGSWMFEGSTTMPFYSDSPGCPEPTEFESIGRWNNQVVYTKLNSVHCMPFIHGDADPYVNNDYYSIEHVYDSNDQTKTYYQLYGFKDGGSFNYTANILSSATSLTPDKDDKDYDFVLRDNQTGKISYAKLKATAQVDLTEINNRITNLGDNINTNTTNIYNLSGVVINLSGDINDLSNQISGLTGNYWVTDGEQNTNNCKTGQINVLTCYVIDGGQLTCNANIHMNDYNLDLGYSGTLYVSNIDSLTSYINIQKGINVWQDSSFSGGLTCNSLQVNSATHFGTLTADNLYSTSFKSNMIECETTCYVNTLMSENNIMIGGTTLSEAQLKKLLALIN